MLPTTHPLATDVTFLASALHRQLSRLADEAFASTGLSSSQAYILFQIAVEPNLPPSHLARRLSLDASTVTRMVEPFIRRGWVVAAVSGRMKRLAIADAGRAKVREVSIAMQTHRERIAAMLGADHARVLAGLMLSATYSK